jgi:hypothetical protein
MSKCLNFQGRCSSISQKCEWKSGPDDSVLIMTLLILDDMIVVETVCLWTIVVCYHGGCDPLVVTICH